ncbi:MAG: histidine--tRNA ligase [Candidatus Bathyarchaeia archaeon]
MARFQTVRGMRDFLPKEAKKLRYVEDIARDIARLYCFEEVVTPLVERYDLLAAKSGEEIKARMYAFEDLGGRKVALRPEFTASIARLMATTLRNEPKPLRLFSSGTLYRYDEPQFGRYREFWQSNYEIVGSGRPEADVEILSLTNHLVENLGLCDYWLKIGHVGILRGLLTEEGVKDEQQNTVMQLLDAKRWDEALKTVREFGVSEIGVRALKEVFQAKGKEASKILTRVGKRLKDYESSVAAIENLRQIIELCKESGVEFNVSVETGFARGLEYYTGMIFEVLVPEMDVSLGGGGRYDKLVESFGGEPTPAVGVAHGLDRIALAMDQQNVVPQFPKQLVAVIPIGEEAVSKALEIAVQLRKDGVAAELEVMGRTVSRALQDVDRRKVPYAVILGPKELEAGKLTFRDMKNRQQHLFDINNVPLAVKEKMRPCFG